MPITGTMPPTTRTDPPGRAASGAPTARQASPGMSASPIIVTGLHPGGSGTIMPPANGTRTRSPIAPP